MARVRVGFVFGDSSAQFTGGDLVCYRLALMLASQAKVTFYRLDDWTQCVPTTNALERTALSSARSTFERLLDSGARRPRLRKLLEATRIVAPLESSLEGIRDIETLRLSGPGPHLVSEDHLIATSWPTGFVVWNAQGAVRKHHFIQNEEDHPFFSGDLRPFAGRSFGLPIHKMVVNRYLANRFAETSPADIVRPGVDTGVFQYRTPSSRRHWPTVLFPARLGGFKGTVEAIDAMTRLRERIPGLEVIAFGNRHGLRARHIRVPQWVRLFHNPSTEDLVSLYNAAGIFLLPSKLEGLPLSALEAMACGCVVVMTPNAGADMILAHGENGIVARGFAPEDLVESIASVAAWESSIDSIVVNARATAAQYSWRQTADDFIRSLRDSRLAPVGTESLGRSSGSDPVPGR